MKTAVKDICKILTPIVGVPVFDYSFPDGFSSSCVVVNELTYNEELEEGDYNINIYAPNKERVFEGTIDKSYPDITLLTKVADLILPAFCDRWDVDCNSWVNKRTIFKEGDMHYLNIRLTIQFN